jgi:hypothetical protein
VFGARGKDIISLTRQSVRTGNRVALTLFKTSKSASSMPNSRFESERKSFKSPINPDEHQGREWR